MSISELAEQSALTVPTIKFYIRQGLLHPGTKMNRTRSWYGLDHLSRLRLIRTMIEVGRVPIAAVKSVVDLLESPELDRHGMICRILATMHPQVDLDDTGLQARQDVVAFLDDLGWRVAPDAPSIDTLAAALAGLRAVYGPAPAAVFTDQAGVVAQLAALELAGRPVAASPAAEVEWAVAGTLVFEQAMVALRRLAHEALSTGGLPVDPSGGVRVPRAGAGPPAAG